MSATLIEAPAAARPVSPPDPRQSETPAAVTRITRRDREEIAERLLASSAEHSFDPLTAIDWSAPIAPDRFFVPPHRVTLYGTPLWEQLSHEQQVELSKHEVASMMHLGIWFEVILMNLLTRHVYELDPTSKHVQYAFTEIADECRHSTMFGMALEKFGTPDYSPPDKLKKAGKLMLRMPSGPATWAAILLGEELIDTLQREGMRDNTIQPIMRDIVRIHVIEEARHVRYAREELARQMAELKGAALQRERVRTAITASVIATNFVSPRVYRSVGIEPEVGAAAARRNPHRRETMAWMGAKLVEFLREVGLIGGPSELIWKRAGLIPA